MTAPLTDEELLRARGWTEVATRGWRPSDADAVINTRNALTMCRSEDKDSVHEHGSVLFRPTAEQAQSPILAACAAANMLERDVIERQRLLLAAWEAVYRARDAYHRHSFTEEWTTYETALRSLAEVGGPDLRAEERGAHDCD